LNGAAMTERCIIAMFCRAREPTGTPTGIEVTYSSAEFF
jgi:hypothetical protein